tara:strand:+ start:494 stop:622 length:129 start_codon:yes stop_codon:yes gene_type:complete
MMLLGAEAMMHDLTFINAGLQLHNGLPNIVEDRSMAEFKASS